jgi:uncharacterized protein YgiM (DUF1202 family)
MSKIMQLAAALALSAAAFLPTAAHAAEPAQRACTATVAVGVTNVRKGPGLDYDVALQLDRNEAVTAIGLDLSAKWVIVYVPDRTEAYWVWRKNLKITRQCQRVLQRTA